MCFVFSHIIKPIFNFLGCWPARQSWSWLVTQVEDHTKDFTKYLRYTIPTCRSGGGREGENISNKPFFFYRWTVKTRLTFFSTDGQSWDRTNIFSTDGQTRDRTKTDCLKQAAHGLPCVHARLDHAQNACSPNMHLSPYSIFITFVSGRLFLEQWKVGTEQNYYYYYKTF